jgi:hypothetical protein
MKYGKGVVINVFLSLIIPSLLYTYYYPWLYNHINHYTKRGEDLNDKMDIINVMLLFLVTWAFITGLFFMALPLILKKIKK